MVKWHWQMNQMPTLAGYHSEPVSLISYPHNISLDTSCGYPSISFSVFQVKVL